jgi:hypothetical protein
VSLGDTVDNPDLDEIDVLDGVRHATDDGFTFDDACKLEVEDVESASNKFAAGKCPIELLDEAMEGTLEVLRLEAEDVRLVAYACI